MKNINIPKIASMIIFSTMISTAVSAHDKEQLPNTSPQITIVEQIPFSQLLTQLDFDKNGSLSLSELEAGDDAQLSQAFQQIDLDADSEISVEEFNVYFSHKIIN